MFILTKGIIILLEFGRMLVTFQKTTLTASVIGQKPNLREDYALKWEDDNQLSF